MTSRLNHILIISISLAALLLITFFNYFISTGSFPDFSNQLSAFDTKWYLSIINNGYSFDINKQSNVAFFPLFPFVWKWLGINTIQMALLNGVIFLFSIAYLACRLNIENKSLILFCFGGFLPFFLVPYSESFFFATTTLMLVGIHKENHLLTYVGVALAILSRSASMIFIVAFSVMIVLAILAHEKQQIKWLIYSIVLTCCFTGIVLYVEYSYTGIWNGFFISQSHWDFKLGWPTLPFKQGAWPATLFDTTALFIGIVSGSILLKHLLSQSFFHLNTLPFITFNQPLKQLQLFSLLYLFGCTLLVVLFLDGSLRSLGRFVFCTPFLLVLINLFVSGYVKINWTWKLIAISITFCFLLLPSDEYPEHRIQLLLNILLFSFIVFNTAQQKSTFYKVCFYLFLLFNLINQSLAFSGFLKSEWMG